MTTLRNISATVESNGWVTVTAGNGEEMVLTPESAARLFVQMLANQDIILTRHLGQLARDGYLDNLRIPE